MHHGSFRYLIKHELAMGISRFYKKIWIWVYVAIILILAGTALTIWGGNDKFNPTYILFSTYMFPFLVFGISVKTLKREWEKGTYGWWLTLPYSRFRLLAAKAVSALIQVIAGYSLFFITVLLLGIYSFIIHGEGLSPIRELFATELQYAGILIGVSPFMLALGLLATVVRRSVMKPLTPMIWIAFGLFGNIFSWVSSFNSLSESGNSNGLISGSLPDWIWLCIIPVWMIAALLFAATVHVCNKYLQV
ncbi:ABC transporter permease [Cohnella silvisoli]|uniref:ABC transporter permease subunit n=1 Tax=Cohnella silvisoli TaxID=2873699 RepID=A0ABV1KSV1_9BACL|nr:ABC transporter permease [Cohnella silvisoli]MCD9021418.1 ABC transporter permease subunit [Cohnella silvisoli]